MCILIRVLSVKYKESKNVKFQISSYQVTNFHVFKYLFSNSPTHAALRSTSRGYSTTHVWAHLIESIRISKCFIQPSFIQSMSTPLLTSTTWWGARCPSLMPPAMPPLSHMPCQQIRDWRAWAHGLVAHGIRQARGCTSGCYHAARTASNTQSKIIEFMLTWSDCLVCGWRF